MPWWFSVLLAIVPVLFSGILTWVARQVTRRIDVTEAALVSLDQKRQDMEIRLVQAEARLVGTDAWLAKMDELIEEIRKDMVRKEDLQALGQRIDDALRRTPYPRKR